MLTSVPKKEVIYQKVGNEIYVIPVVGSPPKQHFKEAEQPVLPHSGEPINREGLKKYQELKDKMFLSQKI